MLRSFGSIALLLLGVLGCRGFPGAAHPPPSTPPNIVLFLVDDLGWRDTAVSVTSEPPVPFHTPHLAELARRGISFTDAYAAAPVCTPTRTSILTGQDPGRTRITYWILHSGQDTSEPRPDIAAPAWRLDGLSSSDVTLPRLLRTAGYQTIHVGKAHFGAHGSTGADPRNLGFDVNIAGHASGGPGSYRGTDHFTVAGREGKLGSRTTVWDIPGLEQYHGEEIYLTEALAREAVGAVETAVAAGRPFYLSFCPYAVHVPIMANERLLARYERLDPREAAYATMVESVDNALGELLATLDRLGVADNTLVVFTSDNGGLSAHARGGTAHTHNAPLASGKGSAYEGGTRVPMVVRWPGVTPEASTTATPVISQDLFTTFLAAAGVPIPPDHIVDGRDLRSVFAGRGAALADRPLVWHQPHQWGAKGPGIEPFTSIRVGAEKLIYFHADRHFELFDLSRDIGERTNLAPRRPERVVALAERLEEWFQDTAAQTSIHLQTGEAIEGPLPSAIRWRASIAAEQSPGSG